MSYKATARDKVVADEYLACHKACSFCGAMTEHNVLVEYGARCYACFTKYVTGGNRNPQVLTKQQREATVKRLKAMLAGSKSVGPRDWAVQLRNREHSGEALSRVQRDAWRVALREDEMDAA